MNAQLAEHIRTLIARVRHLESLLVMANAHLERVADVLTAETNDLEGKLSRLRQELEADRGHEC